MNTITKKNMLTAYALIALFISIPLHADTYLLFGATGWIGIKLTALLEKQGEIIVKAQSRLENRQDIQQEIDAVRPDFVINAAGVTGRPNVDWCETHKQDTIRANLIGALNLADVCYVHSVHLTNFGTGCIYEYDTKHPINSGIGFTESDTPNFDGSYYSHTKSMLNSLLADYPNVLNLRLRMPISDDLSERSFVTKIIGYSKVINIPNSMTVLSDLLPVSLTMMKRHLTGIYNFVNPGTISHNEILDLYTQFINPTFTYENFSIEEQNKILTSKRSNNELDTTKLLGEFPTIPHIKESMINVFKRMAATMQVNSNTEIQKNN